MAKIKWILIGKGVISVKDITRMQQHKVLLLWTQR